VHRTHDANVVNDRLEVRQQLADPRAGLADLLELVRRAEHLRVGLYERRPAGVNLFGCGLAVALIQQRLVIQQVVLRGRTGHVQVDDPLGLGREVRRLLEDRLLRRRLGLLLEQVLVQEPRQRRGAEALGRFA